MAHVVIFSVFCAIVNKNKKYIAAQEKIIKQELEKITKGDLSQQERNDNIFENPEIKDFATRPFKIGFHGWGDSSKSTLFTYYDRGIDIIGARHKFLINNSYYSFFPWSLGCELAQTKKDVLIQIKKAMLMDPTRPIHFVKTMTQKPQNDLASQKRHIWVEKFNKDDYRSIV